MLTYTIDKGKEFGSWKDKVSKYLYHDSLIEIKYFLKKNNINTNCSIGDFGGGNGILKNYFKNLTTIDMDINKNPDILDNILTHKNYYDLVILRYVLHYLNDYEVIKLFKNINAKNILIIQFINKDLRSKYLNSKNELKYFRNEQHLMQLIPIKNKKIYSKEYLVTKEYYINRIGIGKYIKHKEILNAYYI